MKEVEFKYVYLLTTFLLVLFTYIRWMRSGMDAKFYRSKSNFILPIAYTVIYALVIGLRTLDGYSWVDTVSYHMHYNNLEQDYLLVTQFGLESDYEMDSLVAVVGFFSEWLWDTIMKVFIYMHQPAQMWFLFIASCYMGFTLAALIRIFRNNHLWIAFLFFISSFCFLTYSYNTIRSGAAGAILLYALSYLIQDSKKSIIIGYVVAFIAVAMHRSMALPVACFTVVRFCNIRFITAFWGWVCAIAVSIMIGPYIQQIVSGLGFDERITAYLSGNQDTLDEGVSTSFRIDFLLYSAVPILFAYYVIISRNVHDKVYNMLINTYVMSNAFWVLIIRTAYTDRAAYLSWFLFPLIMAYPLLKLKIWPNQVYKVMNILLLYVGFTITIGLFR